MKSFSAGIVALGLCLTGALVIAGAPEARKSAPQWNARAAASYLDARMEWWLHWPNAARDHDTACVSCHTAVPYAIARPALQSLLGERDRVEPDRTMVGHVIKRVRLWTEVEPFYPDQTRGLPKSSESRGTEAVLNALILATHDAATGTLTDETRQAFDNMWALQFKNGDLKGGWAWLNFKYEPWEAPASPYYGAALAAVAIGTAPDNYAATPQIQDRVKLLAEYLKQGGEKESLFNRVMILWAANKLEGILAPEQRQAIVDAIVAKQQADGGWSISTLGDWKRVDATALDRASDGYATGLITLVLQQTGMPSADVPIGKGRSWLVAHQDAATGGWSATSLNKERDPKSDAAKFMSDAATGYAVLALTHKERSPSTSAQR